MSQTMTDLAGSSDLAARVVKDFVYMEIVEMDSRVFQIR